jgi:VWFA-related protein
MCLGYSNCVRRPSRFVLCVAILLGEIARAQQPAQQPPLPTFQSAVTLVTSDVVVRDRRGQFQANLTRNDFELFEDGVKQQLTSFLLVSGGRVYQSPGGAQPAAREGIVMPSSRPVNDAAGRIFIFVIDDLHLNARDTPRLRQLFRQITKELVHDGDLFGVVSTGTSSIAIDLNYDRARLEEAANKINGSSLTPTDILQQSATGTGQVPQEVMHRANVAFSTMYDMLNNLQQTQHRRKAVVLISNGYDFDPFASTRAANSDPLFNRGSQFNDADLTGQLAELTRQANRANATIYTFDPRGLVAGQDIDQTVDSVEWATHLRKENDSLRVMAEQTGGIAVVNTNNFTKALQQIDAETSDYYVLGYYSTNPDPTQRRRMIEIKLTGKKAEGMQLTYRTEYTLKAPARR